jgi:hypothetical protein
MGMADETKKTISDSLRDWGIDVDRFGEKAKASVDAARGDFAEVKGTVRQALVHARDVVVGMQNAGSPAAAELKAGFERAWQEIESAFRSARDKARGGEPTPAPEERGDDDGEKPA